jgi:hypothetical protein
MLELALFACVLTAFAAATLASPVDPYARTGDDDHDNVPSIPVTPDTINVLSSGAAELTGKLSRNIGNFMRLGAKGGFSPHSPTSRTTSAARGAAN